MSSSFSYFPYPPGGPRGGAKAQPIKGVADYLQSHDRMRTLLPTAARLATLQKACEAALPHYFADCSILQFEAGQLVIAAPNGAVAAKLKQKLPNLQENLILQGWQVNAIRLKVQVGKNFEKSTPSKQLVLSNQALAAFAHLEKALDSSERNAGLKAALQLMVRRHRRGK